MRKPQDLLNLKREALDILDIAVICEVQESGHEYHVISGADVVMSSPQRHLAYRCAIFLLEDALGGKRVKLP